MLAYMKRKRSPLYSLLSICIALGLVVVGITNRSDSEKISETVTDVVEDVLSAQHAIPPRSGVYYVERVIDGDTIVVWISDVKKTIRLIGVNTPESVDPRQTAECFGKESAQFLKELLEQQWVELKDDPTQQNQDRYGRLLRYVYRDDGLFINQHIIASGYGYEYTYEKPYQFQEEFKSDQIYAEKNSLGLWTEGICES